MTASVSTTRSTAVALLTPRPEPRWGFAFIGVLGYLFIEYTRLASMFPVLQPLQLGKIAVALSLLGLLIAPKAATARVSGSRALDFTLICFLLASIFSAIFAEDAQPAWLQIIDDVQWLVIYFLLSRTLTNSWRMRVFVFLYLLLNLKLAQFAIRGYFSGLSMGRSSQFMAAHGSGAGSSGFFANEGDFGVAMCVVWAFSGPLLAREKSKIWKYFIAICFLFFLGAIMASGSRGAMLGAAVVVCVGFLRNPKRIAGALTILIVCAVFVFVLPDASKARLESALHPQTDETASIRLNLWSAGLKMFEHHPVLGVGPANFPSQYLLDHPTSDRNPQMWVPHSIYIQALSELGLAGLLPLLLIAILFLRMNAQSRKILRLSGPEAVRSFEYRLSLGLDLAFFGYLVSGAFLAVLYYPHLWILLGFSAALNATCRRQQQPVSLQNKPKFAAKPIPWRRAG